MVAKPTKPTPPTKPSRLQPAANQAELMDDWVTHQYGPLPDYMSDAADFVEEQADNALAAALGGDLPPLTGKALQFLRVNAGETAAEFAALGTAALVNTGVASGNVPAINASGFLPAGIAVNWSAPQTVTTATAIDFTSIPSTARQIFVASLDAGVSGTDHLLVQMGVAGTPVTTGYTMHSAVMAATNIVAAISPTAGFGLFLGASTRRLQSILTLTKVTGNTWIAGLQGAAADQSYAGGGKIALAGAADMVRVTRTGTNTITGTFVVGWI